MFDWQYKTLHDILTIATLAPDKLEKHTVVAKECLEWVEQGIAMNTLLKRLHDAANRLSYFNAAEGTCWYEESQARSKALAEYREAVEACKAAGIDVNIELSGKGYLI